MVVAASVRVASTIEAVDVTVRGTRDLTESCTDDCLGKGLAVENHTMVSLKRFLLGGDAASQRRTLDLLAANDEMLREALIKTGLGRRLGPDLVKIIDSGPLEVRPAAAAAMAQMEVDSDVAVPAFSKLLDSTDMPLRVAGASLCAA